MAVAGTLEYLISINSSKLQSGLKGAESKFQNFGNKMSSWAVAKGQVLGRLVETAGKSAINFVKGSVQESMSFDKAMSQVAATLGKSTDQIGELSDFARKMGSETAFTATQAAEALNYMALAGYDTEKSMKMLPTVLNLAAAGNMDLAQASDMVTDAQSALGLSIEETEVMVDQMAKTSSKTNTSVAQLGEAFLTVGGTAKMMRGGTQELSAVLGVLADNGIKGSEGGTALRNVLLSLSAPTDKAAKQIKQLGLEVFDSEGNMRNFPEILADLNDATKEMTQQERTSVFNEIFNKRDLKAVEALLGTDMKRWEELYKEIGNAEGSAEQMAETQLDNLAGDITKFQSALGEAKLTLVEGLTPGLRKFVQKGTTWVQKITKAFGENGFSGAIKEVGRNVKELITDSLGIASDSSWFEIGSAAATKIKTGLKTALTKAKIKIADMLGVEDAENATWGDIASKVIKRIKGKFTDTKIKIADILGVENPQDATWGDIAGKVAGRIKSKFTDVKIKIADLLGIEDANDASWGNIAGEITKRIKGKIGDAKLKIADLLGIEDANDATWSDIGGEIGKRIKGKIGDAKLKIADLLGIEDEGDVTWTEIGSELVKRLKGGLSKIKLKAADLLGIENPEDATWEDIGKNILDGITKHISNKGSFLKKIVLGDEYNDKSTWSDVGKKISGWLDEAFSEGGIINAILGNTAEKTAAIAEFAGELLSGFATWVGNNSEQIVAIVTAVVNAISKAAPVIVGAIGKILSDPKLFVALGDLVKNIWQTIFGTPDKNLEKNLFDKSGFSRGDYETLRDYINAYNEYQDMVNRQQQLWENGEVDTEEYRNLEQNLDAANKKLDEYAEKLKSVFGEDGKSLWSSFNTWMYEHKALGEDGKIHVDMQFDPDDSQVTMITEEGYTATVTLNAVRGSGWEGIVGGEEDAPGSAKGLWNVPYDNYLTRLHQGETVLTKSQSRQLRDGQFGGGNSEMIGALQGLRNDMKNMRLVVGKKTFGKAVVDYGGRKMGGYIGGADSRLAAGYGT